MLKLWIRALGQGLAVAFVLVAGALVCKDIVEKTWGHRVAKRIIHVFHEWQFESLDAPHASTEALSAWKYSWRRAGWHVRVLTTFEAQHTGLYKAMLEALSQARVSHRSRETACYLRYAAMAAVGGGWLADLDTVPTYLTPGQELSNNGDFTIYQPDSSSLMSGTKMEYERSIEALGYRVDARGVLINRTMRQLCHSTEQQTPFGRKERSIGNLFPLTGAGNAKQMLHIASRISKDVNLLYATKAELEQQAEEAREQQQAEENAVSFTTSFINEPVQEEGSVQDSTGSSTPDSEQNEEDNVVELDSDLEDYDHEAAGERIGSMLDNLKCQDRIEIMDSLHTFYQNRKQIVETEMAELETLEKDFNDRDEETKESSNSMVKAFEAKGMTEVQVLVKCSATLQAGANGTFRKRQKFSKAAKSRAAPKKKVTMLQEPEEKEPKAEAGPARPTFFELFGDDDKEEAPEEAPEEEEELPEVVANEEDLKDQDVWDLNRAKELWSRMNEKAGKVAGGKGSAIEILQAMVVVQEGNAELQRRSELAKKATATMNAAVDFLTRNFKAGIILDFDSPSPEVEYVKRLHKKLFSEIDVGDLEDVPDAEELEEECQELERILAEQEKEAFQRQREEKEKSQEEEQDAKLEKLLDDHPEPDLGEENSRGASKQNKSAVLDARLEGLQIQGAQPKASAAQRMKQAARTAAAISTLNKDAPAGSAGARHFHSVEDFKDDPKVKMLREHIATKDGQIDQARKLLKRMRFERRLLHYCRKKAKRGFDSIVQEFEPPSLDEIPSADEASEESASEAEPPEEAPEQAKAPEPEPSRTDGHLESEKAAEHPGSKRSRASETRKSGQSGESGGSGEPSESTGAQLRALLRHQLPSVTNPSLQGLEIEEQLKKEVEDLQAALSESSNSLREEKVRQKTLRKEIKDLRKEFHQLSSSDQDAPKTLEGLQEQIKFEEKVYRDLQNQIDELKTQVGQKSINKSEDQQQAAETHGRPNLLEQPDDNVRSRQTSSRGELSRPASAREHAEQSRPASARDPSESRPDSVGDRSPSPAQDESLVEQPKRASSTRAEPTGSLSARPEHLARSLSARADLPGSPRAASAARSAPSSRPPSSARSARSIHEAVPGEEGQDEVAEEVEAHSAPRNVGKKTSAVDLELPSGAASPEPSKVFPGGAGPEPNSDIESEAEATAGKATAVRSSPGSKTRPTAEGLAEGFGSVQEEATTSVAELVKVQARTEEMRGEIHDIDAKLKKLKALLKSKGDIDIVAAVREVLGLVHEEEVKAPPAYHQCKRELKEQQDKIRLLRKKWWDDHRDFDGLVEKVRNQMGGNRQIFAEAESKDLAVRGTEHAAAPVRSGLADSGLSAPDASEAHTSQGFRGSANAPSIRPPSKEPSNAPPPRSSGNRRHGQATSTEARKSQNLARFSCTGLEA
ncbi:unnamed protein product [Symbiodinium microadriaticum]|nr:unnamed protein product [Symbiodinium microadriaticum]